MAFSLTFKAFPSPDGPLFFTSLPWDSEIYGFPFYELRCDGLGHPALAAHLDPWLRTLPGDRPFLVAASLRPDAVALGQLLTRHGFYPVETILKIELPLSRFTPVVARQFRYLRFRPAEAADLTALTAIARDAFATDRFHLDPNLPPEKAGQRYARWINNSYQAGENLFVLEDMRRSAILGFVLAQQPDAATFDVTLAAIVPSHHDTGTGLLLYQAMLVESVKRKMRRVLASISINNLNSLKVAERLGFTTRSAAIKYHLFRQPGADNIFDL